MGSPRIYGIRVFSGVSPSKVQHPNRLLDSSPGAQEGGMKTISYNRMPLQIPLNEKSAQQRWLTQHGVQVFFACGSLRTACGPEGWPPYTREMNGAADDMLEDMKQRMSFSEPSPIPLHTAFNTSVDGHYIETRAQTDAKSTRRMQEAPVECSLLRKATSWPRDLGEDSCQQ